MPRKTVAVALFMTALAMRAAEAPEVSFERGARAFRGGQFAEAVVALEAAVAGFLAAPRIETYIATGRYPELEGLETSLVYLALAHFRLGNEEAARAAIHRLTVADRIAPTYAELRLPAEVADFDSLATALGAELPRNRGLLAEDPARPLPAVRRAEAAPHVVPSAGERPQIAAALLPSPGEPPVAEAMAAPRPALSEPRGSSSTSSELLQSLRSADDAVAAGDLQAATIVYERVAQSANATREALAEAGSGLYRIGAYRSSVAAFRRMGAFASGEEDLRYYFAVALYESGDYVAAARELACALPYLEENPEILRVRWKIENTAAVVAMK